MCTVSNIGDFARLQIPWSVPQIPVDGVTRAEFYALKTQVDALQLKFDLLDDIMTRVKVLEDAAGVPPCEDPEKTDWIKSVRDSLKAAQEALSRLPH